MVPLSEREQRMLDQIETALREEDPKFAFSVRDGQFHGMPNRTKILASATFLVGLVLLIGGLAVQVRVAGFPILSLLGFVAMFIAAVSLMLGLGRKKKSSLRSEPTQLNNSGRSGQWTHTKKSKKKGPGFSGRMEDRFRRRYE